MASDLLFPWSAEAGPLSQVWIFSAGSSDPTALPLNFRGISTINQVDNLKRRRKRRDLSGARNPDVSEPLNTRPFVKRRRLTRNFMTSPLSQPYACPGSYICGRGLPRVALWARFGTDCRQELRKAAMMNALRRRAVMPNQEIERRRFEAEGHSFLMRQICPFPQRPYVPMPASPLSMTNYAAMDEDEDVFSQVDDHDSSEEDDCDYGFRIEPEESIFPDYDGIGSMGIPQPPSLRFGAGPGPSAEAKMDHYPILSRTGLPTPPPSVRSSDDAHRRGSFASSLPDESVLSVTADVACSSTRGM